MQPEAPPSEPSSNSQNEDVPKTKKRKTNPIPYISKIVLPMDKIPDTLPIGYLREDGLFIEVEAEKRDVKMKKTKQEISEDRKKSRKIYMSDPENVRKMKENQDKPEVKKKRQEYAKKQSTIDRKKELSKEKRLLNKILRENDPEYYSALMDKVKKRKLDDFKAEQQIVAEVSS